ncbi:MAG: hypothetical protein RLY71_396 [Pseudomonadota bacterium]|jgi:ApaG protein
MPHPEFTCSVLVQPILERTDPAAQTYAYAYTVTIRNTGDVPAQLIGRHWIITDQRGRTEEVRGLGVVGKQPLLQPGEAYEYTSWTELSTPQGSMRGTFFCFTDEVVSFEAVVPEFMLGTARDLH